MIWRLDVWMGKKVFVEGVKSREKKKHWWRRRGSKQANWFFVGAAVAVVVFFLTRVDAANNRIAKTKPALKVTENIAS